MKYECLKLEERRIIEEMYAKGAKPGDILLSPWPLRP